MNTEKNDLSRLMGKSVGGDVSLKAADVCKILKECRATGVTRLEFGGLSVEFGNPAAVGVQLAEKPPVLSPQEIQAQEIRSKASIEEELRARRDEVLAQLDVIDPSLYEELAEKGALTHGSPNAS